MRSYNYINAIIQENKEIDNHTKQIEEQMTLKNLKKHIKILTNLYSESILSYFTQGVNYHHQLI